MHLSSREKAKREGQRRAETMYDDHYGGSDQWSPDQAGPRF